MDYTLVVDKDEYATLWYESFQQVFVSEDAACHRRQSAAKENSSVLMGDHKPAASLLVATYLFAILYHAGEYRRNGVEISFVLWQ